ncbi:MAG: hypothetical protein ACXV8V_01325 [Ilumatobacteraceae bacterium]
MWLTIGALIEGTVSYNGPAAHRRDPYKERFIIDLTVYEGSATPEKSLPDLVTEVKTLREEMAKWTDGSRGIQVKVTDRNKDNVRSERPYHFMRAAAVRREKGWRAVAEYYIEIWQRRSGWYSNG